MMDVVARLALHLAGARLSPFCILQILVGNLGVVLGSKS